MGGNVIEEKTAEQVEARLTQMIGIISGINPLSIARTNGHLPKPHLTSF